MWEYEWSCFKENSGNIGGHVETPLGTFTVKLKYKLHLNVIVTEKQKPHVLNHQSNLIKHKGLMKIDCRPPKQGFKTSFC